MITDCTKTVERIWEKIPGKTNRTGLTYLCELALVALSHKLREENSKEHQRFMEYLLSL